MGWLWAAVIIEGIVIAYMLLDYGRRFEAVAKHLQGMLNTFGKADAVIAELEGRIQTLERERRTFAHSPESK